MPVGSLSREDSLEEAWQPTPVFFLGESHGLRSLVGYSPQSHKELDMTEVTEHAYIHNINLTLIIFSVQFTGTTWIQIIVQPSHSPSPASSSSQLKLCTH